MRVDSGFRSLVPIVAGGCASGCQGPVLDVWTYSSIGEPCGPAGCARGLECLAWNDPGVHWTCELQCSIAVRPEPDFH
jgi:hypothetical protein